MKYRRFGRTNFQVSEVAYGLWGMSGWSGSDDQESLQSMQMAGDLGCNFFYISWAYGGGKSGSFLTQLIAPKNLQWPASPKYKYQDVFPSDHVFKYARLIREKLGTDSIDVLQFHVWD